MFMFATYTENKTLFRVFFLVNFFTSRLSLYIGDRSCQRVDLCMVVGKKNTLFKCKYMVAWPHVWRKKNVIVVLQTKGLRKWEKKIHDVIESKYFWELQEGDRGGEIIEIYNRKNRIRIEWAEKQKLYYFFNRCLYEWVRTGDAIILMF